MLNLNFYLKGKFSVNKNIVETESLSYFRRDDYLLKIDKVKSYIERSDEYRQN